MIIYSTLTKVSYKIVRQYQPTFLFNFFYITYTPLMAVLITRALSFTYTLHWNEKDSHLFEEEVRNLVISISKPHHLPWETGIQFSQTFFLDLTLFELLPFLTCKELQSTLCVPYVKAVQKFIIQTKGNIDCLRISHKPVKQY